LSADTVAGPAHRATSATSISGVTPPNTSICHQAPCGQISVHEIIDQVQTWTRREAPCGQISVHEIIDQVQTRTRREENSAPNHETGQIRIESRIGWNLIRLKWSQNTKVGSGLTTWTLVVTST
jgi:hypothetical protein